MSSNLSALVGEDLAAYFETPVSQKSFFARARHLMRAFLDVDFRVVFYIRLMHFLIGKGFKRLGILVYFRLKSRYSVDVGPWSKIGGGLRLMHGFNIVIGTDVEIGRNVRIFNGVTLGNARPDLAGNAMPTIGSNCILGTGAKLLGKIVVEDNIIIGANTVIRKDVVAGSEYFDELLRTRKIGVADSGYIKRMAGLAG